MPQVGQSICKTIVQRAYVILDSRDTRIVVIRPFADIVPATHCHPIPIVCGPGAARGHADVPQIKGSERAFGGPAISK
jgi:hypothetical protein